MLLFVKNVSIKFDISLFVLILSFSVLRVNASAAPIYFKLHHNNKLATQHAFFNRPVKFHTCNIKQRIHEKDMKSRIDCN